MTSLELVQSLRVLALEIEQKNGKKAEYACQLIREAARRIVEKANTL